MVLFLQTEDWVHLTNQHANIWCREELPDWVQIYFVKILHKEYKCNICEVTVITDEKCLDLLKHITTNHKEIHELHKENSDASIGFQIEFLHLNMLKEEETKADPIALDSVDEPILDDVNKCIATTDDNGVDMHYVLLPRKKKVKRSDGGIEFTRKRSWVWKYFDKLNDIIYRCNLCNVVLSIKGCNTNNMNRHVRTRHPTVYKTEMEKKKDTSDTDIVSDVIPKDTIMIVDDGIKELDDSADLLSKHRRSWVWSYFKRVSSTLAVCRLCNRTICHGGNATGNMNRHLKMLHQKTGESEDTNWIWKVFELTEHDFYYCKICRFKCMKFVDMEKNISCILEHLKSEHGVVSGDQIITGVEYDREILESLIRFGLSNRGHLVIHVGDHKFVKHESYRKKIRWTCSKRIRLGCKSSITTHDSVIVRSYLEHNHS